MGISLTDKKPQNFPVKTVYLPPEGHFQLLESEPEPILPRPLHQLAEILGDQAESVYGSHSPRYLTRDKVIKNIKAPRMGDVAKVEHRLMSGND